MTGSFQEMQVWVASALPGRGKDGLRSKPLGDCNEQTRVG